MKIDNFGLENADYGEQEQDSITPQRRKVRKDINK